MFANTTALYSTPYTAKTHLTQKGRPCMCRTIALAAVALGLAMFTPRPVRADIITFAHTWTGTESLQGSKRIFRDGVPSTAGSPKTFPGTVTVNATYFAWQVLDVLPGSVVSVLTTQDDNTFIAIYDSSLNPLSLATNYLGDAGSSMPSTSFSVTAPASGRVEVVGMAVHGTSSFSSTFSADITYTPNTSPVPAPPAVVLVGLGTGCVALRRYVQRRAIA
jgi:hypothetical protein